MDTTVAVVAVAAAVAIVALAIGVPATMAVHALGRRGRRGKRPAGDGSASAGETVAVRAVRLAVAIWRAVRPASGRRREGAQLDASPDNPPSSDRQITATSRDGGGR